MDTSIGSSNASAPRQRRRLSAAQFMRWRWFYRAAWATLFQPYAVAPLLSGTWLWNVWLRGVGADVSMCAIMLCDVADHDLLKVSGCIGRIAICADDQYTGRAFVPFFLSLERNKLGRHQKRLMEIFYIINRVMHDRSKT